jgi:hypothetical protein
MGRKVQNKKQTNMYNVLRGGHDETFKKERSHERPFLLYGNLVIDWIGRK